MFEPFQDRNPHFFGKISLSWFLMKVFQKPIGLIVLWPNNSGKNSGCVEPIWMICWLIFDHIGQTWTNLDHLSVCTSLFWPFYLDLCIRTCLFGPVYTDLSIWTCIFEYVYLDLSLWTHIFRHIYLDPSIWTRLFGPAYLDQCFTRGYTGFQCDGMWGKERTWAIRGDNYENFKITTKRCK